MFRSFRVALSFLTIIPGFGIKNWQEDDFKKSLSAYPLVGLLIAVILFLFSLFLTNCQAFLKSSLIVSAWYVLTGALHFDGFCDLADAVFVAKPSIERQAIAKDPRIGSFALLAGVLIIVLKIAALSAIDLSYVLIAPIISRSLLVLLIPWFKLQASSRLAKAALIGKKQSLVSFIYGMAIALLIAWQLGVMQIFIPAMLVLVVLVFLISAWIDKRMDGLNGDSYGTIIELSELIFLLFIALFRG